MGKFKTKETFYNERVWLNDEASPSTGFVVAYHGLYDDGDENMFLRIGDCGKVITLHKINEDSEEDFIEKLELLNQTIGEFIKYLKSFRNVDEE